MKNIEKGDNFTKVDIRQNTFQNQHAAKRVVVERLLKILVQDKEIIIVSQYLFWYEDNRSQSYLNNETNIRNEKYPDAADKVYETSLKPLIKKFNFTCSSSSKSNSI